MSNFTVYILSSKRNGTLYTGMTGNLVKRVYEHKHNLADGFTKKYNVHNLVMVRNSPDTRSSNNQGKTDQGMETVMETAADRSIEP